MSALYFQYCTVFLLRMRTKYTLTCDVCHWKDETGVFQFIEGASPLDARCHLDNHMSSFQWQTSQF